MPSVCARQRAAIRAWADKELFGDNVKFDLLQAFDNHGDIILRGRVTGDFTRLLALWEGRLDASAVLPPTGSPLGSEATVDRATVRASLAELVDRYRPAAVNTLDPDPDPVVGERLGAEQTGYSDHIDHTAAAPSRQSAMPGSLVIDPRKVSTSSALRLTRSST